MPKVAVLISGEYRKLDITRKTMTFLDDPEVDVYVSTWDKTTYVSPRINLYVEENITSERILKDLSRPATIRIDSHKIYDNKKYNSKMIYKWKSGIQLIESSGIKYDNIFVLRPDLFFNNHFPIILSNIVQYTDNIGFAWATANNIKKLPDLIFTSSANNIRTLIRSISIDKWITDKEDDWHTWWYNHVNEIFPNMQNAPELGHMIFCRYWMTPENTYINALDMHHDWRDLRILYECDMYGDKFHSNGIWPDEIVDSARRKWTEGYYNKYKVENK
jgi:hypothetical protein